MAAFGPYLRELRRAAGLTLKQVESVARVSNAYLSQIERGLRNPPHPDILKRLATVYEVPPADLLIKAGYLDDHAEASVSRLKVEAAYKHVLSDPTFRHGTRMKGSAMSLEGKRFIVEMYETLTGRNLLGQPETR
jgi:transcriptional regulator with XRE-family HTH domain